MLYAICKHANIGGYINENISAMIFYDLPSCDCDDYVGLVFCETM